MDLPLVRVAADFTRPRRRLITLLAAAGLATYGVYKAYYMPYVIRKRRRLAKLLMILISLTDAFASTAETLSVVSADLSQFLRSDSDEVPSSLRQISKIACSDGFSASISKVSEAVTIGVVGAMQEAGVGVRDNSVLFAGSMLDKVFSPAGTGFVSVVAGSVARGLVSGALSVDVGAFSGAGMPEWVMALFLNEDCRRLMGEYVERFVGAAVTVYLERTMEANMFDQMFAGLTHPNREEKIKDLLVSVCNGAVATLVKTSHVVLTSPRTHPSVSKEKGRRAEKESESPSNPNHEVHGILPTVRSTLSDACRSSAAWVDGVSSTIAVPSNRRFLGDVTGKVTFEAVRSILDHFLSRMYDSSRVGLNLVHHEMVRKGMDVVRYAGSKSTLINTACLSICLHVAFGSKLQISSQ